jgi:sugar lactone lactonase YvrE
VEDLRQPNLMNANTSVRFSGRHCFRGFALGCLAVPAISTHAQTVVPPYVFRHLAGMPGGPGKADGPGAVARFNHATGVAADSAGNVYVTDSQNDTIRKISPAGIVTTVAGSPSLTGSADGTGSTARFSYPTGPALDASGNLFVADWGNDTIRKITPAGVVTTGAGTPYVGGDHGNADGMGPAARFWAPSSVAVDVAGNVFVADSGNHEIRKIALDGTVSTLALASNSPAWPAVGFYPFFLFGVNHYGFFWDVQYTTAYPSQIAVDRNGNLYFGNYESGQGNEPPYYLVLKVDPSGVATAVSQFPTLTSRAGPALDSSGNLHIGSTSGLLRLNAGGR